MKRRSFLKLAGLSTAGIGLGFPLNTKWAHAETTRKSGCRANWQTDLTTGNRYFTQKNLRTEWVDDGYVLAKYDGWWWAYPINEFDDEFHDWWIEEKCWYYDKLLAYFDGEVEELGIPNGGHHHPMLTTYGAKWNNRGDSRFHLNSTPKGFTLLPKADKIPYIEEQVQAIYDDPQADFPADIFRLRKELYRRKDLWDKTRFATLELYTGRPVNSEDTANDDGVYGFDETHSFQNMIENPMSTLTYMSLYSTDGTQTYFDGQADEIPTFEFRGFCWLISYYNPGITDYEKTIADYINGAHSGYHGGSKNVTTNIYLISEEFDNSPGHDPYGRGKRVVPPPETGLYTATKKLHTARSEIKNRKMTKSEKIELLKKLRMPL